MTELVRYEAACRAVAEATSIDEVKDIRDKAVALKAYARQSQNFELELQAVELRQRATRRLGEFIDEQKKTVGLATGGGGKHGRKRVKDKPTLQDAGIDKNLANEARQLAALPVAKFEALVVDTRKAVRKAPKYAARQATKKQRRDTRVSALAKDLPKGKFVVFVADCPWRTETWSEKGKDRSADNHYPTMTLDELVSLDVAAIGAKNRVLFMWATGPHLRQAFTVLEAWGFEYKTILTWDKVVAGTGKWLLNQTEHLLICTKGDVPAPGSELIISSLYRAKKGKHSAKPERILDWIDLLYPNVPKIELFRRGPAREGWSAWGNETKENEDD